MKTKVFLASLAALVAWSLAAAADYEPDKPNVVAFPCVEARFIRLVILGSSTSEPCIDELEVYSPSSTNNLALASAGSVAAASSCLPGYAIHKVAHLNDGRYGNSHSWIAASHAREWAQIELPQMSSVDKVVFSRDREGRFRDRLPNAIEIRVSTDGIHWETVARETKAPWLPEGPLQEAELLNYAFACEDLSWKRIEPDPWIRILKQMDQMLVRFSAKGLNVSSERRELMALRQRHLDIESRPNTLTLATLTTQKEELLYQARLAKRRLFFREPDLAVISQILFVKRHPYEPSHNYSVIFDAAGGPGGGVFTLDIPRLDDRLEPGRAVARKLFDAGPGIVRDPTANDAADKIYFGFRRTREDYFHVWVMDRQGGSPSALTEGPFHDYFPRPLPDGGLAFISTRCKARFICWRPQAFTLFRMDADGQNIHPLSFANLSEWTPSLLTDGRLLWMRSEYLDKGADFGHTLWAIRPDGTHPELIFGNNTLNCYANGHRVPDSSEILCTLVSHGGDLNGPLALIDPAQGRFNPRAITNITPDVAPRYHMDWARQQCFRDPVPVSRDYFLCSHAPYDKFGLYLVDRYGNREILYLDPEIGCMSPTLLRPVKPSPALPIFAEPEEEHPDQGQFFLADIYQGLSPAVTRGTVKYLRICQELRADLAQLPNGEYQKDHEPFQDWYATPTHKVTGPHGWPSYVAKGVLGTVPVAEDGSANFYAPAGKVLYFQALDANFNELQRMRSVIQLQPGEKRGCIGCHEPRLSAPPQAKPKPMAARQLPSQIQPPPWGAGPFAYEKVVQPVWDARCIRCHDSQDKKHLDLTATLDKEGVPASYRALIEQGWVHYFDYTWGQEHHKAEPLSFGTLKSKLWLTLNAGHYDVQLTQDEVHRVKCWIDLNCPLWPDYVFRPNRLNLQTAK